MELDKDLQGQFDILDKDISKFKNWAIALAVIAFTPFPIAGVFNFFIFDPYITLEDFGSYVGGVSAPFGSISGILFVYVAFLGQRQQLIYNQQEIRVNVKALQDSLKEAESQRIAIESQNKQFQIQSFENVFFNLIELFEKQSNLAFSENYGDQILIEQLKKFSQEIRLRIFDQEWKSKEIHDRYEIIQTIYDLIFSPGFSRIRTLVGATISILFHLERNRNLIDHSYFLSLFFNSLNVNEQRIIFYSFFSNEIHLNSDQRRVYLEFIYIFYTGNLIDEHIKDLLPEF